MPPPAESHGYSDKNAPVEAVRRTVVPPAETTFAEVPGQIVPGPSPDEAKNTTFCLTKCESYDVSPENSLPPQLFDTSPPPAALTILLAMSSAVIRSAKLFDAASTSTICAPGAIACAHSTSNEASNSQPGSYAGFLPLA